MAEYLAASGSRKVTELTSVSGVSGSTSMPIVMGGITVRISHTDFVNSTVFNRTLVSGSAQVIQLLPNGTVSGSSQVTYGNISSIPSGIVSGSSQVISLLPTGLVSGSSQITYTAISSIPNGIISSSTQVLNYNIFATTGSNTFIGNQVITGSITSSLQEGYILVGNSLGITQAIPTSSFGGVGFPFSGSAEITGSLEITGSAEITGSVSVTQTISTQILLTPQVLTGQLIVPTGFNGMLTGPVSNGGELTIENGSNLVII
jgi:cytoskeletal protein CcmA (bactofilin family)